MNHSWQVVWILAWRNLWRNHRRTLIMLAAIAVGVWAMIFMTAMMRGMVDDMVRGSTQTLLGHVQMHHPDYIDDPNIVNSIEPPSPALESALSQAVADKTVKAWTTRVRVPAVVSSERESTGITLVGIDPEAERPLSFIGDSIDDGRYLEGVDDRGVILGARLVEKLETNLGKRVVLMSQDPDNEVVDRGFRIVGIYRSDPSAVEEQFAFTGRATAQRFLRMGDQVSELEVLGQDYRQADLLAEPLQALVEREKLNLEVLSWPQLDSYLGSMLPMMDGFVFIWIVVVFTALSFGLVNTLAMAVFERVREIGLMQALGMRPGAIMAQVLCESILLLGLGLIIGNLTAWLTIVPLQSGIDISVVAEGMEMAGMSSVLYPTLLVKDMLLATVVVLILGVVASLIPAWRAARYEPIKALTKI
ncbi:ABC transporter permease [Maricurvus nonylphenolicus]|uniref:ABC transporter permease n=1 Tax=Maricurvus nonylphenolicus TaxID=1008307 RepID=UPI0036F32B25